MNFSKIIYLFFCAYPVLLHTTCPARRCWSPTLHSLHTPLLTGHISVATCFNPHPNPFQLYTFHVLLSKKISTSHLCCAHSPTHISFRKCPAFLFCFVLYTLNHLNPIVTLFRYQWKSRLLHPHLSCSVISEHLSYLASLFHTALPLPLAPSEALVHVWASEEAIFGKVYKQSCGYSEPEQAISSLRGLFISLCPHKRLSLFPRVLISIVHYRGWLKVRR